MIELFKVMVVCGTLVAIALPVAFLVAFSLPHNSEMRQICLKVCYWAVVLLSVGYFAMPIDIVPDVLFPIGLADDLIALGIGYANFKKAMRPSLTAPRQ